MSPSLPNTKSITGFEKLKCVIPVIFDDGKGDMNRAVALFHSRYVSNSMLGLRWKDVPDGTEYDPPLCARLE